MELFQHIPTIIRCGVAEWLVGQTVQEKIIGSNLCRILQLTPIHLLCCKVTIFCRSYFDKILFEVGPKVWFFQRPYSFCLKSYLRKVTLKCDLLLLKNSPLVLLYKWQKSCPQLMSLNVAYDPNLFSLIWMVTQFLFGFGYESIKLLYIPIMIFFWNWNFFVVKILFF